MSDHDSTDRDHFAQDRTTIPATPQEPVDADAATGSEPPVSTSWATVTSPWGTPGNHLTGPIPRIRKRDDGSLTHRTEQGEES